MKIENKRASAGATTLAITYQGGGTIMDMLSDDEEEGTEEEEAELSEEELQEIDKLYSKPRKSEKQSETTS